MYVATWSKYKSAPDTVHGLQCYTNNKSPSCNCLLLGLMLSWTYNIAFHALVGSAVDIIIAFTSLLSAWSKNSHANRQQLYARNTSCFKYWILLLTMEWPTKDRTYE